jgi:hypothetical protein
MSCVDIEKGEHDLDSNHQIVDRRVVIALSMSF